MWIKLKYVNRRVWFWMPFASLFALLCGPPAAAQEPAQYQVIKVKFKVMDRDGEVLSGASVTARLDATSNRLPPSALLVCSLENSIYLVSSTE